MTLLGLTSRFNYGKKYKGMFLIDIVMYDPEYIKWYMNKYKSFRLSERMKIILNQFLINNDQMEEYVENKLKDKYKEVRDKNIASLKRDMQI